MNRTIKEATVRRFHYDSHDRLRTHLADFLAAYNFARRLKTLVFLALRTHLQNLDIRARSIHPRSDPPDAGTENLGSH
jgi:RNA-directed DNA polymerase